MDCDICCVSDEAEPFYKITWTLDDDSDGEELVLCGHCMDALETGIRIATEALAYDTIALDEEEE